MGKVIPLIPSLASQNPLLNDQEAALARRARRRHNFMTRGVPTGLTALVATGVTLGIAVGDREPATTQTECGLAVVNQNEGANSVANEAFANSGIQNPSGYRAAVQDILAQGDLHPGQRYVLWFNGGEYVDNSATSVGWAIASCLEISPPTPIPQS